MKNRLLIIYCFFSISLIAQQPVFEWAKQLSSAGNNIGLSISTDEMGNIYTTGAFQDTVDFDPGPGESILISEESSDIFVSKFTSEGQFVWAISFGSSNGEGVGVETDNFGNVYVIGRFQGETDFDPDPDFSYILDGDYDYFILKIDSEGSFKWVKEISGIDWDSEVEIAVDDSSNVFISGVFDGIVDFDPGTDVVNLGTGNEDYAFFLKLDLNGNYCWAKIIGGDETIPFDITIDNSDNLYATGYFIGNVDFDPGIEEYHLSSSYLSMYILKLSSDGEFLWAKELESDTYDSFVDPEMIGLGIVTDKDDNVYTTGEIIGTLNDNENVSSGYGDDWDAFVLKLNSNGNILWGASIGGAGNDRGRGIVVDTLSNIYIVGNYSWNADFDPGPEEYNIIGNEYSGGYILKLNTEGHFTWVRALFSGVAETTLDKWSNIYSTGQFKSTVDFDLDPGVFELTTPNNNHDVFIHKMTQQPCSATPIIYSTTNDLSICPGDSSGLALNALLPFWITDFTYIWSTGETTDSISIFPDTTSIYSVIASYVSDSIICITSDSVEVVVVENTVEIPYNGVDDDCDEGTFDDDLDQDGFPLADDCDDNNPLTNPAAPEVPYNSFDDDCNELTPDDDLDQDGFVLADDCDDNNPEINPNAEDIPNNNIDEDCDGADLLSATTQIIANHPTIFPNPTTDLIHIHFSKTTNGNYQLQSVDGEVLLEDVLGKETMVDLESLTQGVYILLLKTDQGVWTEQVVKI